MTKTVFALSLAVIGIVAGAASHAQQIRKDTRFKTNDEGLRKLATTSPAPTYPPASLAKKVAGVVVAGVLFDAKGAPEVVDILQSPDAETSRAVRDAVMQWKFGPHMGLPGRGILFFYFHLKGPQGVVLSPPEMRAVTNPGLQNVKREDEPPVKYLTDAEFRTLAARSNPLLLDVRDRETFGEGHEKGAVNIPLEELSSRGPAELPVSRHVVIDCRDPLDFCAIAVHFLASAGFGQVSILRR
jgi:rhodanese-related sulfurtransferase